MCDKVPAVDANSIESESADEEDTEDAEDPTDSDVDDLDPFHVFLTLILLLHSLVLSALHFQVFNFLGGRILHHFYKNYVLSAHSPLSACT